MVSHSQFTREIKAQISLPTVQRPSLPLNPIPLAAPNPFLPAVIFFRGCILQSPPRRGSILVPKSRKEE